MNLRKRVRHVVADILEISEDDLSRESGLNRDPAWDSLNHVAIIASLEDELGIEFDDADVVEAVDLTALIGLVEAKVSNVAH